MYVCVEFGHALGFYSQTITSWSRSSDEQHNKVPELLSSFHLNGFLLVQFRKKWVIPHCVVRCFIKNSFFANPRLSQNHIQDIGGRHNLGVIGSWYLLWRTAVLACKHFCNTVSIYSHANDEVAVERFLVILQLGN